MPMTRSTNAAMIQAEPNRRVRYLSETSRINKCLTRQRMQWRGHVCWRPDIHLVNCIDVLLAVTVLMQTGPPGPS